MTTYNAAGQPEEIDPPGYGTDDVTSFTYDPARGSLLVDSRTDPLAGTTTYDYDAFNRRTTVTGPTGLVTVTAYDELDRVTSVTRSNPQTPGQPPLVTMYDYDDFGDLVKVTLPRGNLIVYGYEPTPDRLDRSPHRDPAVEGGPRARASASSTSSTTPATARRRLTSAGTPTPATGRWRTR